MEDKQIPQLELNDAEKEQRGRIMSHCNDARSQKSQKFIELDDMDYDTWYFKARKTAQAYIEPRLNDEDVNVVTGSTREKGNTLVNTFLNYNLEADVTAFNEQNIEESEAGFVMTKLIKKSRRLEMPEYDIKRPLYYTEKVNQGNVFVREHWMEYQLPEKEEDKEGNWEEKLGKVYANCNSLMLTGLEVFPGNIRQFFLELQPFFITRKVISYAEGEAMFKDWKRWKYVSPTLRDSSELASNSGVTYDDFQMIATDGEFIEVIEYFNKWKNEYQMLLNGTPMLDVNFALKKLIGICEYPFSKGDGEPISANFFFSRGVGSKNRMDQKIIDEFYKMMIVKTRRSYKPPMANMGNYDIGASVYLPGKIFQGIDPEKLKPIGDNQGVTPAEFNMVQFIKGVIDEKTVDPIMQGQAPENKATARQVMLQNQRSMVKIGMQMLGVINLEKRMAWLRLNNIIKHWTEPVETKTKNGKETNEYRILSLSDTLENGQKGLLIMEFAEEVPEDVQILNEEKLLEMKTGQKIRKTYINPKLLQTAKYIWDVNVVPTEKNTNMLKAAMFEDSMQKMLGLFMPLGKQPNVDYLAERWAMLNEENPERIWQQTPQMPQGMPPQGGQMPPEMQQGRMGQAVPPMPRPSLNTLAQ